MRKPSRSRTKATPQPVLRVPPTSSTELVKAGRLIELFGAEELTKADRLLFNILLKNAHGESLGKADTWFEIDLADLRGVHESNRRIRQSVRRLMGVVVQIEGDPSWDPEGFGLTHLLGDTDISSANRSHGRMRYSFPPKMARLMAEASIYARLQIDIMQLLSSKYALILYEMIAKRANLDKRCEEFTLDEFRNIMGVPTGKLTTWSNLKKFAIEPAVREVNKVSPYYCAIEPTRTKRKVTGVKVAWGKKGHVQLLEQDREIARRNGSESIAG